MASKGGTPLYCTVCSKQFSGPVPAQQHYRSNEHKKKEQNSRRASLDPYFCKVCNISCDTRTILENHFQSPRHLAMIERQQQMGNHPSSSSPATSTARNATNGPREYVFDGNRGYCYVCKLDLTSQSHAEDHLKGQKHAKKKKQVDITQKADFSTSNRKVNIAAAKPPEFYCEICKVPFSGPESAQQHYSSEKHRKKETIARQGNQQQPSCDLCNVTFTGEENHRLHIMSDKHKRKVKLQEQSERGELLPLTCDICACSFSGQENAQQHFESQKHKRNLQNKEIQDRVNLSVRPPSTTISVQQTASTAQPNTELDKVTSGVSDMNFWNSQDHLKQFQSITKRSQLEQEDQDIIKPFPVERRQEDTPAVQDRIKPCEPDIIQGVHLNLTETPHVFTHTQRSGRGDGDCFSFGTSYSDEDKIKQEMSSITGSSLSTSVSGVDSFAQSDEPVRVIRNNLTPLPPYGRGRAFLLLKNSNLLPGKPQNVDKGDVIPNSTGNDVKASTSTPDDQNTGYTKSYPGVKTNHSQTHQNTNQPMISRSPIDDSQEGVTAQLANDVGSTFARHQNDVPNVVLMSGQRRADGICYQGGYEEILDVMKPFRQSSGEVLQTAYSNTVNTAVSTNKPTIDQIKVDHFSPPLPSSGYHISGVPTSGKRRSQPDAIFEPVQQEPKEYTFDRVTHRGRCHVCNIDLTSVNHMSQHTAGGKHRKAAEVWRRAQTGTQFIHRQLMCTLCNVTFSGPEARDQHNQSERHLQKERIAAGRESSFYCTVCKIACSGEASYQQHLSGSQHRKLSGTLDIYGDLTTDIDRTRWYHCDVCNCNLNSFEQLEIHKRSPRHLSKMSSMGLDSDSDGTASPLNLDRTRWYTCPVCMCNLNSEEQLRIHEKSPGHLKRLQKTGLVDVQSPELNPEFCLPSGPTLQPYFSQDELTDSMTPLESFLSIELFPKEFRTDTDDDTTDLPECKENTEFSGSSPFNLVVSDTQIPFHERFADVDGTTGAQSPVNDGDDDDSRSGGTKKGQGSDLAWATRSRGNADRKSEPSGISDRNISSTDCHGHENEAYNFGSGARLKERSPVSEHVNPFAATHRFYCHTCKAPMNTRESYENHLRGKRHMQKVCTESAPLRRHCSPQMLPEMYVPQTVTSPRNYQVELYNKAMHRDALCFLPTGTGKTLVSVLTMSAMLEREPSRNVLFLVDKVLLVLQQSAYIKHELQRFTFNRYNADSEDMGVERRELLVAAVCMGQQNTGGVPLWKHDVVVVTAAFCQNLLSKEILRWQDFSLVVFDEAHHCEKAHPYNALLQTHHASIPPGQARPKILGLTASPAGKADVPKTLQMLEGLISNMGGVRMTVVEEPVNIQTLREYQSNAEMIIHTQTGGNRIESATDFIHGINVYIVHCYLKLSQVSNIKNFISVTGITAGMSSADINHVADIFVERNIDVLQSSLISLSSTDIMDKVSFSLLQSHVREICMARSSLGEGGVLSMIEDFIEIENTNYGLKFAKSVGLPCKGIEDLLHRIASDDQEVATNKTDVNSDLLLQVLTRNTGSTMKDRASSISLVLVKMRGTAFRLTRILKQSPELQRLGLNTATVVGHGGSGAEDKGMSVNQQKRVLQDIKQYKYQIIVATSVAEEGVDWPECERVISMYPPSTVTALVQMRGRARRKNSQFIVLCENPGEEEKLNDIIKREQNMMQATQILVDRDKQQ